MNGPGNRHIHCAFARFHRNGCIGHRSLGLHGHRAWVRLANALIRRADADFAQCVASKSKVLGHVLSANLESIDGHGLHVGIELLLRFAGEREQHLPQGQGLNLASGGADPRKVAPFDHQFGRALPTVDFSVATVARMQAELSCAHLHLLGLSFWLGHGERRIQCCLELPLHSCGICTFLGGVQADGQPVLLDFQEHAGRQAHDIAGFWLHGGHLCQSLPA